MPTTPDESPSYGDDRDWLLRFCPPACAPTLRALFDVERETATSARADLEHQVAHVRLEWWQEELTRLAHSQPRHPATRTLAVDAAARSVSPPDLRALIEYVRVDLACVAFLRREELDEHLGNWAQSIFRHATLLDPALSYPSIDSRELRSEAEGFATRAGPIVRELELLREFTRHARSGRIYHPLGDPPAPHEAWVADPLSPNEVAQLERRRQTLVTMAKTHAASVPKNARSALRIPLLWLSFALAPPADRPARLDPLRRTIAAWRGALALERGALPSTLLQER